MRTASAPLCALALVACGPAPAGSDESSGTTDGTTDGTTTTATDPFEPTGAPQDPTAPSDPTGAPPDPNAPSPHETPWTPVLSALPFPADITSLTVGGREFAGNFANRGKIEVLFDHDSQDISVELRLFDFTTDDAFHGDDEHPGFIDRIGLWAYASAELAPPSAMPSELDCTVGAWKDGCQLRSYYDGKAQPARSGADMRVHLPRSWRGELIVVTEDNNAEPSYPRLGDVKIDGLCSSGSVTLDQGTAEIELCHDLSPAPTCPPDQVSACEVFVDAMGDAAAWSPACPCPPALYGSLVVTSREGLAADITLDVPITRWHNVHVANAEPAQPHACTPEIADCPPDLCTLVTGPFSADAEYNLPGPAALPGGGYTITARSSACHPVAAVASPEAWQPGPAEPPTIEHGHIRVCTDCL